MNCWPTTARKAVCAALDQLVGQSVTRGIVEAHLYDAYRRYAQLVPHGQGQALAAEVAWERARDEAMKTRYPQFVKGAKKAVGLFDLKGLDL